MVIAAVSMEFKDKTPETDIQYHDHERKMIYTELNAALEWDKERREEKIALWHYCSAEALYPRAEQIKSTPSSYRPNNRLWTWRRSLSTSS